MIRCLTSTFGRRAAYLAAAAASVGIIVVQAGCGSDIDSPDPSLTGEVGAEDPDEAVAFPGFACNEQRESWIEIHGEHFTPLVLGTMSEEGPEVVWPKVRLTRVEDLEGNAVDDGRSVELEATGTVLAEGEAGEGGSMETAESMLMHDAGPDASTDAGGDAGEDTGSVDSGGDTGTVDTGTGDTGTGDTGTEDTGSADTGVADTGSADTGMADTGMADMGMADTGPGGDSRGGDAGGDSGTMADGRAGDAGTDEDAGMAAEDAGGADVEERHLVWLSDTRIKFKISPELDLEPGVYDITVITAREPGEEGEPKEATADESLGIMPRPTVESVEGRPYCLAQSQRTVTISGAAFLKKDETLPTVYVGDSAIEPDIASGCRTPEGPFGTYEICDTLTITLQEGAFPPSTQMVRVENGEHAACHSLPEEDDSSLRVVSEPAIFNVEPDAVCSAQTSYDALTLTGRNFLRVPAPRLGGGMNDGMNGNDAGGVNGSDAGGNGDSGLGGLGGQMGSTVPTVELGDFQVPAGNVTLEECEPVEGNVAEGTERCSVLKVAVPAGALPAGGHPVNVTNPGAANCQTREVLEVTSVDPPTVDSVGPQPITGAQDTDRLTLSGDRFAVIDGATPTVTIGSDEGAKDYKPVAMEDCRELKGPGKRRINLCETLEIEIAEGDFTVPEDQDSITESVVVTNPAPLGCDSSAGAASLTVLDPPELSEVRMDAMRDEPICTVDGEREMTVLGEDFLFVEGRAPTVAVGMWEYEARPVQDSCETLQNDQAGSLQVEACDEIRFTVSQGDLGDASYPVRVFNPEPVGGITTTDSVELSVVGEPTITTLSPELVCPAENAPHSFTLSGRNFIKIESMGGMGGTTTRLPSLTLNGVGAQVTVDAVPDADCTTIEQGFDATVKRCTTIEFSIAGGANAPTGVGQLVVENPAPAGCSSDSVPLTLDPAPTVNSAGPQPTSTCTEPNFRRIVVSGEKFLRSFGRLPSVTIGQKTYQPRAAANCTPVPNISHGKHAYCDDLIVYVPLGDLSGTPPVEVTNPSPRGPQAVGCTSSNTVNLTRCP